MIGVAWLVGSNILLLAASVETNVPLPIEA